MTRAIVVFTLFAAALLACGRMLDVSHDPVDGGVEVVEIRDSVAVSSPDAGHDVGPSRDAAPSYAFVPLVSTPIFTDNMARPDGSPGNGWWNKTASAFGIASGALRQMTGGPYADRIALRPSSDAVLDVEVSVTFVLGNCCGWTGIFARVQPESDAAGTLVAYRLALNSANAEVHTMREGAQLTSLRMAFPVSLVIGERYRAAFRVTGRDPVIVEALVSRLDGATLAQGLGKDESSYRITGAGRVGLGGGAVPGTTFDDVEIRVP